MSDQTPESKKATAGNSVKKAASTKKVSVKKATPGKKKTVAKKAPQTDSTLVPTLQSIVQEMSSDRESRDKQMATLIQELRDGFGSFSDRSSQQGTEHKKEMTGLYQSLQNAFGKIKSSSVENEEHNQSIFESLSDSIMKDHEQSLKQMQEQRKLQDKKIEHMTKQLEQRTGRNRLIAVPGVILAVIGIFYMFYVVDIMESAMTSMSKDIHQMQLSVGDMTGKMETISQDTSAMNENMQQLNGNIRRVSKDMNVMTHNVAPAMQGMRTMMPWSP